MDKRKHELLIEKLAQLVELYPPDEGLSVYNILLTILLALLGTYHSGDVDRLLKVRSYILGMAQEFVDKEKGGWN